MHDGPDRPDRLAGDVKRDEQAFFGCRNDRAQIGVAPFEVSEQQGAVLIEDVSARAKIARGPTSHVRIPHAGDRWPIEPLAAHVRRLAIPRQQAEARRVTLRNIQDRFGERLKYGARGIGQCTHQRHERAVLPFMIRQARRSAMQLLGAENGLQRSAARRDRTLQQRIAFCAVRFGHVRTSL